MTEDKLAAADSCAFVIARLLSQQLCEQQEDVDEVLLSSLINTLLILLNPNRSFSYLSAPFSLLSLQHVLRAAVRGIQLDHYHFRRKDEERQARYQQILFLYGLSLVFIVAYARTETSGLCWCVSFR